MLSKPAGQMLQSCPVHALLQLHAQPVASVPETKEARLLQLPADVHRRLQLGYVPPYRLELQAPQSRSGSNMAGQKEQL